MSLKKTNENGIWVKKYFNFYVIPSELNRKKPTKIKYVIAINGQVNK
jgi:hypothetical protein